MAKLTRLKPRLTTADLRTAKVPAKTADPHYQTPQHREWRERVILRAGGRCQWVEHGVRCIKAEPLHRLFADHIVELKDGGAPHDVGNGQALCGEHHSLKTAQARAERTRG